MPIGCRFKLQRGKEYCVHGCPATAPSGTFRYVRVEDPADIPPPDPYAIDVAVLDMNHGWPNLGHDSMVHAVREIGCDLVPILQGTGLYFRAISFEVRRRHLLPEPPGGRFVVYLGTGGPGHPDPYRNDGIAAGSQGIVEDPAWQTPCFQLLEAIRSDEDAVLLAVCHTFEVLCRWSGAAQPVMRGRVKGGKSSGVLENILTPEALEHPWFSRFSADLSGGRRLRVMDSRLYDMIPDRDRLPSGVIPISYEAVSIGGPQGDALTMIEMARDRGGVMPRILAVNHHPEIVNRARERLILEEKLARGDVTREWYEERATALTHRYPGEDSERLLHLTSDYTLLAPMQFHLHRQLRLRAEKLGIEIGVHEDQVQERPSNATEGPEGRLEGAGVLSH